MWVFVSVWWIATALATDIDDSLQRTEMHPEIFCPNSEMSDLPSLVDLIGPGDEGRGL